MVELGARARARNRPAYDAALARGAGGSRQGAGIRARPGPALGDSPAAGIHDDFVTPGSTPWKLGCSHEEINGRNPARVQLPGHRARARRLLRWGTSLVRRGRDTPVLRS